MNQAVLLRRVKQAVHAVEPDAEVILYGSRAREDARSESDWDSLEGCVAFSIAIRSEQERFLKSQRRSIMIFSSAGRKAIIWISSISKNLRSVHGLHTRSGS
jgi:hypothetical protein